MSTPTISPFLGRIIVKAVYDDTETYLKELYGVSKDSLIQLPDEVVQNRVPLTKGIIVKLGKGSFGDRFRKWYGEDIANEGKNLKLGDKVYFVENQTYSLDVDKTFFIISDEHIMGYEKVTETDICL